jgi:hypothetical protein
MNYIYIYFVSRAYKTCNFLSIVKNSHFILWNQINTDWRLPWKQGNTATCLCLSQAMTWTSHTCPKPWPGLLTPVPSYDLDFSLLMPVPSHDLDFSCLSQAMTCTSHFLCLSQAMTWTSHFLCLSQATTWTSHACPKPWPGLLTPVPSHDLDFSLLML